jgi:hypothetical protein
VGLFRLRTPSFERSRRSFARNVTRDAWRALAFSGFAAEHDRASREAVRSVNRPSTLLAHLVDVLAHAAGADWVIL